MSAEALTIPKNKHEVSAVPSHDKPSVDIDAAKPDFKIDGTGVIIDKPNNIPAVSAAEMAELLKTLPAKPKKEGNKRAEKPIDLESFVNELRKTDLKGGTVLDFVNSMVADTVKSDLLSTAIKQEVKINLLQEGENGRKTYYDEESFATIAQRIYEKYLSHTSNIALVIVDNKRMIDSLENDPALQAESRSNDKVSKALVESAQKELEEDIKRYKGIEAEIANNSSTLAGLILESGLADNLDEQTIQELRNGQVNNELLNAQILQNYNLNNLLYLIKVQQQSFGHIANTMMAFVKSHIDIFGIYFHNIMLQNGNNIEATEIFLKGMVSAAEKGQNLFPDIAENNPDRQKIMATRLEIVANLIGSAVASNQEELNDEQKLEIFNQSVLQVSGFASPEE